MHLVPPRGLLGDCPRHPEAQIVPVLLEGNETMRHGHRTAALLGMADLVYFNPPRMGFDSLADLGFLWDRLHCNGTFVGHGYERDNVRVPPFVSTS